MHLGQLDRALAVGGRHALDDGVGPPQPRGSSMPIVLRVVHERARRRAAQPQRSRGRALAGAPASPHVGVTATVPSRSDTSPVPLPQGPGRRGDVARRVRSGRQPPTSSAPAPSSSATPASTACASGSSSARVSSVASSESAPEPGPDQQAHRRRGDAQVHDRQRHRPPRTAAAVAAQRLLDDRLVDGREGDQAARRWAATRAARPAAAGSSTCSRTRAPGTRFASSATCPAAASASACADVAHRAGVGERAPARCAARASRRGSTVRTAGPSAGPRSPAASPRATSRSSSRYASARRRSRPRRVRDRPAGRPPRGRDVGQQRERPAGHLRAGPARRQLGQERQVRQRVEDEPERRAHVRRPAASRPRCRCRRPGVRATRDAGSGAAAAQPRSVRSIVAEPTHAGAVVQHHGLTRARPRTPARRGRRGHRRRRRPARRPRRARHRARAAGPRSRTARTAPARTSAAAVASTAVTASASRGPTVTVRADRLDVQHVARPAVRGGPVDPQPLALPDRERERPVVRPEHRAVGVDDGAGPLTERAAQEAGGVAVRDEADVVAVRLVGDGEPARAPPRRAPRP